MIRRLKACLNGSRTPGEHPALPVTPAQLAAAARAAVDAGAEAVHVHPRDRDGRESLVAADVGAAVRAIRAACPGVPVGVTTGLWITGGVVRQRTTEVGGWAGLPDGDRPDFASVNVSEEGFAALVQLLATAGIGAEAGVWSPAEAAPAAAVPLEQVLVEVMRTPAAEAAAAADAILAALDRAGTGAPRLLHGEQEACWPLVAHAARLGLPTRIGLEDTLVMPDGSPAVDNAGLVRAALAVRNAHPG
jgi:uncharacterized protein (DUF849 family)